MNPQYQADQLAKMYEEFSKSPVGLHLLSWIKETANTKRESAGRLEPIPAWGQLKLADGIEEVASHISSMQLLGKSKLKARSPEPADVHE
jgi:hypothetical protein